VAYQSQISRLGRLSRYFKFESKLNKKLNFCVCEININMNIKYKFSVHFILQFLAFIDILSAFLTSSLMQDFYCIKFTALIQIDNSKGPGDYGKINDYYIRHIFFSETNFVAHIKSVSIRARSLIWDLVCGAWILHSRSG